MKKQITSEDKNKEQITTIKITKQTKARIDRLKEHERETYEQVLKKILFILNLSKKDSEKASDMLRKLDLAIKKREYYLD